MRPHDGSGNWRLAFSARRLAIQAGSRAVPDRGPLYPANAFLFSTDAEHTGLSI